MTQEDISDLSYIKRTWTKRSTNNEVSILDALIKENPAKLAKNAASKGDYRLIGLAMGYHAEDKDAEPLAVECKTPVETQNVVFGCVPPPAVIFKLMLDYNVTLLQQPGFPPENQCGISDEVKNGIIEMGMKAN